jgi:hypothetical protein
MSSHSSEFQRKFIDEILYYGVAIEKALNEKDYITLVYIINDFLRSLRNIRAVVETSIRDENEGYDPEIICQEEAQLENDDFIDDETETTVVGRFPSIFPKTDHGPS